MVRSLFYLVSWLAIAWACAAPHAPIQSAATAERAPEFIEDDYERALKEARARGVPVFVDGWAPW